MKLTYLLSLAVSFIFGCLSVSAGYKSVVFIRHDATTLTVAIEDDFNATINDGNINVTSSKGIITMPVAECDKWQFNNNEADENTWQSSLESINSSDVTIVHELDKLVLRGVKDGEQILFSSLNGDILVADKAIDNTDFIINIADITSGIYIVTYGNHSVKFTIK